MDEPSGFFCPCSSSVFQGPRRVAARPAEYTRLSVALLRSSLELAALEAKQFLLFPPPSDSESGDRGSGSGLLQALGS